MEKYIKGNLLNVFYSYMDSSVATPEWKFFCYTQASSLTVSNSLTNVSSKSHGNHPDKILQESTFELSNEAYGTVTDLNNAVKMSQEGKPYSFCFCKVSDTGADDDIDNTGLQDVTNVGDSSTFTIGSEFKKFGSGIVNSLTVNSQTGDMSSVSISITGIGGLSDTEPTGTARLSFVKI